MNSFKTGELKYYIVFDHFRLDFEVHTSLGTEILGVVYMPRDCAEKVKEYFENELSIKRVERNNSLLEKHYEID